MSLNSKVRKAQEKRTTEQQTSSNSKQLTLEGTEDRVKLWVILECKGLLIILAKWLRSIVNRFIVEDTGFVRLMKEVEPRYVVPSRKHMTEVILPCIMDGVAMKVKKEAPEADFDPSQHLTYADIVVDNLVNPEHLQVNIK